MEIQQIENENSKLKNRLGSMELECLQLKGSVHVRGVFAKWEVYLHEKFCTNLRAFELRLRNRHLNPTLCYVSKVNGSKKYPPGLEYSPKMENPKHPPRLGLKPIMKQQFKSKKF
ncbi:hypothetical protein Glove_65g86 [Diversispora epigaea]|uniref:Uncharacterized protein n=1 Tax=Diversispora epigaea TaxID=1348612 RepID=A0A397JF57_9GLOM|nr:hypothetical protein Glove_65g86 [Diversispora epigaea]